MISRLTVLVLLCLCFGCEGDYDIRYEWTGMDVMNADNSGALPSVSNATEISASAYVVRVDLDAVVLSCEGRYLDRETPPRNVNPLDSIRVSSTHDFDAMHPAGSSLNEYFRVFNGNYNTVTSLDNPDITKQYSADYFDEPYPGHVDLLLVQPPDTTSSHRFIVYFQLSDSTTFIDTASTLTLRVP